MDCVILQNTYCACLDLSDQLRSIYPDVRIQCMSEEALEIVDWLGYDDRHADFIIADTEACDGDTIDIFRRSAVSQPLILTCSSPDEAARCRGLNVVCTLLKPICRSGLSKALSGFNTHCQL